jgi:hydrophobic/amphiphilic exporter-1 (mainly G- bacteria), HAE1 family
VEALEPAQLGRTMNLTRIAIYRPVAIVMLFLALAAMGVEAYTRLPVERLPNISFPVVRVSISYPGAAPEDVEALVTKPIEDAVVGVNGIDTIESTSIEGSSSVQINFVEGTDVNQAAIDVSRKIDQARRNLPTDASDPSIFKADVNAFPVMNIAVYSDRLNLEDLYTLVSDQIQPLVQNVNGVADVSIVGGRQRQIQVRVDPVKLQSLGLSLTQVQNALANENIALPGGPIRTSTQLFNTRTQALAQAPADLNQIVVGTTTGTGGAAAGTGAVATTTTTSNPIIGTTNGAPVHLSDVAQVIDTAAFQSNYQRFNGRDAVGLILTQQTGVNSIRISDDVRKTLAQLQESMGQTSGVQFQIVNDQAVFTRAAVDDVQRNLYLAVFLTATVLLLFLHTIRNTLMVLVAIPVSLVSTFFVMYVLGFNLDIMSLMALALLIGILVDDSIVVLENINRHLALGELPWEAALNGRSEIGLAAIAITFTDVVVYLPVAFMSGNIGQLFREFGLTIVAATLFSLLVSFTLTPMLASRLLKGEALEHISGTNPWARFTRAWERGFERLRAGYRRVLSWSLAHRWLPVLVGFAMLGLVISFIPLHIVGTEFIPQEDDNQYTINIQMPVGTPVEATGRAMAELEARVGAIPGVQTLFTSVGRGGFGSVQEQNGQIAVGLAVMICLPVALVGAFLGLLVVGDTINIFSLIGMIMLVGLVAKNAILLVDYTNTLRRRGLSRRDALLEAGPVRLRPILMTTMTMIFAMIPLALKLGSGAETRSPMAVVVLGGIITSTLLTLVLVPCAYTYLDDLQNLLLRRRGAMTSARAELAARPTIAGGQD